jgi:hypothetical protein
MSRMTSPSRVPGLPGLALVAVALAVGTVTLAACSGGGPLAPASNVGAPGPAAGSTPGPTEVPGPPAASLEGGTAGIVPGELGTFLWDGLGSDAPWIVPSATVPAAAGAPLAVTLDPGLVPRRWTARWAPVLAGAAGNPVAVTAGDDAAVKLAAPTAHGSWGLQVEISFAEGRRAAWYWSLSMGP